MRLQLRRCGEAEADEEEIGEWKREGDFKEVKEKRDIYIDTWDRHLKGLRDVYVCVQN